MIDKLGAVAGILCAFWNLSHGNLALGIAWLACGCALVNRVELAELKKKLEEGE